MRHAGAGAEEDQNWHIEICVVLSFFTWGFTYKSLLLCNGFFYFCESAEIKVKHTHVNDYNMKETFFYE